MKKILCVCLSATYQRSVSFEGLSLEKVNRSKHYVLHASGKGVNSARVLAQLDASVPITLCPLGQENLEEFISLAKRDNLNLNYVPVPGKIRECWTLLDRVNKTTTELVVGEDSSNWTSEAANTAEIKLLKEFTRLLPEADAVLLAGSKQGKWNDDLYTTIAGMTEDAGKLFLADYVGEELQHTLKTCRNVIVKINEEEFCSSFLSKDQEKDYFALAKTEREEKLKQLMSDASKQNNCIVIVTRGAESTFGAKDGAVTECAAKKLEPVNTTACGDSFNAGFLYEYLNSKDMKKALEKGTWCAAKNAQAEAPGSIQ